MRLPELKRLPKTRNIIAVFGALSVGACTAHGTESKDYQPAYLYQLPSEAAASPTLPITNQTYGPFTEQVRAIDSDHYYDGGSFAKLPRYALQAVVAYGCVFAAMTDPAAAGNSTVQATGGQRANYKNFLSKTYTQSAEPTDLSYSQIITGCPSGPTQQLALVPGSYLDYAESQLPVPS